MEKVILSRQEYMDLISRKPDFSGSEGNLYKKGNRLYKLYHNPYSYSEQRLEQIISFQPVIKKSKLPLGALYFEHQFVGSILFHYIDATSFESVYKKSPAYRIKKLRELIVLLQEFTSHSLILEDLYYGNLIITKEGKVALIDTDGDNVKVLEEEQQLKQFLRYLKGLIIECFQNKPGIPSCELKEVEDQLLSYEVLEQFLSTLEAQTYQKKFH